MQVQTSTGAQKRWVLRGAMVGVAALTAGVVAVNAAAGSSSSSDVSDAELTAGGEITIATTIGETCAATGSQVLGSVGFVDSGSNRGDGDDIFLIHDLCPDGRGMQMDLIDLDAGRFLETRDNRKGFDAAPAALDADMPNGRTFQVKLRTIDEGGDPLGVDVSGEITE